MTRHRNQQPDESNEDFVQAFKMQAEFCGFGAFKNVAIMDRVLAGLLDGNLKENLLKEESLTLDKMDKFITTWNIAKQNRRQESAMAASSTNRRVVDSKEMCCSW
ncbi:conserved hypothetical protein [Culex quinquefasciatus]|uniref:Uncharacterized protein n=1 Tax=Culex quinquefasciatus TaxID=7176 RepID=B0WEP7_CULQU|nr:conserved hypothetical protein [Culex quinquefasciatus]|eukprot:XP_001847181.1 conserved hypothetical protein [Culex quinquefasciatus]